MLFILYPSCTLRVLVGDAPRQVTQVGIGGEGDA
jgi:hypothetical protein